MGLADAIEALTDAELAELLARRPELADPLPAAFGDLASRASAPYSLQACLSHLRTPVREVLDGFAYLGEQASVRGLADLAGTPTDLAALGAAVDEARRLCLVIPNSIHPRETMFSLTPALRRMIPAPFSLRQPLLVVLDRYTLSDLRMIATNLGLGERNETKQVTLARVIEHLSVPSNVSTLLESATHDAESLLHGIHDMGGIASIDTRPYGRDELTDGVRWLFSFGLLAPLDLETVIVPREIALALRGGVPLRAYQLNVPIASTPTGARLPAMVELSPPALIDAIAAIGLGLAREPLVSLTTGGVAVRDVRATAKRLGMDERSVARLLELAGHSNLLAIDRLSRIASTTTFNDWLTLPPLDRWLTLVHVWSVLPATLIRLPTNGSATRVAPLSYSYFCDDNQIWRRGFVLRALYDASSPIDLASLAAAAQWFAPGRWRDVGHSHDVAQAVQEILEEASLLGLIRGGTLTALARATLFAEDSAVLADAAGLVFPPPISTFTVQADLTALAPQELDPGVVAGLARCADAASFGAATVYRFSETSLRRAFDLGETSSTLLDFLDEHARPIVPQPLRYLVEDVARRYGSLRVSTGNSYIRSDDAALLADVVRSKRLAKLKLRLLAPTVAVSSELASKVVTALREGGFLPVVEDREGVAVIGPVTAVAIESGFKKRPRAQASEIWRAATKAPSAVPAVTPLDGYSDKVREAVARLRAAHP